MMTGLRILCSCGLLAALLGGPGLSGYASPAHAAAPAYKPAGGPTVRAASAGPPLTSVDWQSFTYTSSCFSNHPQQFVARNGAARAGFIHFQVYTPIFGDITGDGQPEAIVPYSCTGADFGGVHAFVYTGTAGRPRLLGEIPSSTIGGRFASIHTVTLPALTALPSQRVLQVSGTGYSANAAHDCPDLRVTASYRVMGGRLVSIGSTVQHSSRCLAD